MTQNLQASIRIALASDMHLDREGLTAMLAPFPELEIVFAASNGKDILDFLKEVTVDIVLTEIEMKLIDGREMLRQLKEKHPEVKVIVLTSDFTDENVTEFMTAGACAFLSRNTRIEKVAETIRRVQERGICTDHIVANILMRSMGHTAPHSPAKRRHDLGLTAREIQIIRLICMGRESVEIGTLLNISPSTVDGHRHNIWAKTHCKNIVQLMEFAFKNDLIAI